MKKEKRKTWQKLYKIEIEKWNIEKINNKIE